MKSCPNCESESGLRKILYGLPGGPVDERKYATGGCCISENDPTIKCIDCGWEGEYVDNINTRSQTLEVVELQDISKMSDTQIDEYSKTVWKEWAKREGDKGGNPQI